MAKQPPVGAGECPKGFSMINGVCIENPTPDPPQLVEEDEKEDQSSNED